MMTAAAKFRDDISGAIVTGGTSTAYTVTSYQAFDTLANMNGAMIAFTPHTTSGATVTLNVDGLGAKPLRISPGVELPAGTLIQGTPYVATYFNSAAEWILQGLAGNPYNIPLGGMLEFTGTTAPNSSFVLPYGQPISRSIYAAYFAMVGTAYGAGDGSTFNVIDKRGRVSAGKDDMGGTSANRLTNQSGGLNGDLLGAAGGSETHTLTTAELAVHSHGVTDPQHAHGTTPASPIVQPTTPSSFNVTSGAGFGAPANLSINSAATGITINNAGSGGAHNNVQPTVIVNYILRVL